MAAGGICMRFRLGPRSWIRRLSGQHPTPVGRRLTATVWIVVAVVVAGFPADCSAARWYEDYERAVELIEDGQCSREALQLLGAAVVDKPKPRRNARTIAVKTIDYLPYFQLARAHLACGEADSARHYIEESRRRGVAAAADLDDLERQATELDNQAGAGGGSAPAVDLDELAGLAKQAQETIRRAISASERVNSRRGTDWLAAFFSANQNALTKARDDLATAQEALNDGTLKQDRAAIQNAEAYASRALVVFTGLESEMAALQPPEPTPEPVAVRPTPRSTPTSPPAMTPARAEPVATPSPTPRPIRSESQPGSPAPREIPASLRQAVSDFAAAAYEEVVRGLEPDAYRSTAQQAAAHLLRAAANHAIYCLDGRRDDDRIERVRADVGRSRELDPSLLPDPRFFSPEFIALYR